MRFVGLFALVFALIYIPLWCMRTGLLTRFWAMLGLALGVSLLLIPVGIFGLVLWFAAWGDAGSLVAGPPAAGLGRGGGDPLAGPRGHRPAPGARRRGDGRGHRQGDLRAAIA